MSNIILPLWQEIKIAESKPIKQKLFLFPPIREHSYTFRVYSNLLYTYCVFLSIHVLRIFYTNLDLREDNDLTQKQLAEFLNCTQQTYSRYETGEITIDINSLIKLAIFYNTSVDYLVGLTEIPKPYIKQPSLFSENTS